MQSVYSIISQIGADPFAPDEEPPLTTAVDGFMRGRPNHDVDKRLPFTSTLNGIPYS